MAPPNESEFVIENWNRKGIMITSRCWSDLPHVQLYRMDPEEYTNMLDLFLKRVLTNNSQNPY